MLVNGTINIFPRDITISLLRLLLLGLQFKGEQHCR